MAFCGQCGFLLLPDAVTCPRCKSAVTSRWAAVDKNANAPTIISKPDQIEKPEHAAHSQLDRVQEANQSVDYKTEPAKTEQGKYTPAPPTIQRPPSVEYYAPYSIAPPPPGQDSMSQNSGQRAPYPDYVSPTVSTHPSPIPPRKNKSRVMPVVSLLILFLVSAITVVLILGPSRVMQMIKGPIITPQTTSALPTSQIPTSVPPTPATSPSPTSEQQAQSVIDHYYTAINSQDYQTAYNLWLNYPDSYQTFANGFSDTSHDDYTFGDIVQQSKGKVQVNITVIATSSSYQQTTFQGYYIVEQQPDGSWKITSAKIHKA